MTGLVVNINKAKAFGFIRVEGGVEYFFHRSGFNGFWDDLVEDYESKKPIKVDFDAVINPKGPRAENVFRLDGGI